MMRDEKVKEIKKDKQKKKGHKSPINLSLSHKDAKVSNIKEIASAIDCYLQHY